jgi:RNA polymerase sigma factor (sigma-70 family)
MIQVSSHRIVAIVDDHLAQPPVNVDARVDVAKALSFLEPDARAVVVLHDMEGYSHDEIAQLLNIGASASRMRLHRARATLRAHFRGDSR